MSDFAINGNTALQTHGNEVLYRKVVIDGQTHFVEVPIGKTVTTKTTTTKTTTSRTTTAAEKEIQPFDETTQKEIQQARKFLDHEDKKVRKGAELTLTELYEKAFIEEGKSEKEAQKLAKLALKEDQAALRFEKRQVFIDKDEYKAAKKADKGNEDNYEYLGRKTRKFVEAHKDEFYEDGKFSNQKFKDFMKNIAAEDHQADLYELDQAAEEYDSTRRTMGKAAKSAGLDKEKDKTAGKRALHVLKTTAIGAGIGAASGAAIGYATGTVTNLKDVNHKHINVNDPNFDVTVDSNCDLEGTIDTRKSSAKTGAIAGAVGGALAGMATGLATMKKIKDEGEGEHTEREEVTRIITTKLEEPEPVETVVVPPAPPEEQVQCREEIDEVPIMEEKPDLDYCEYKVKRGESWYDITRDKYDIKEHKDIMDAVHVLKDQHGVKYSENVQPKVMKLYYDLQVGDKVYQLDCDKDVNGTVKKYGNQKQYTGKFQPRIVEQQTGTEYIYNRYETKPGQQEQQVDHQKFTDKESLQEYILENGCK